MESTFSGWPECFYSNSRSRDEDLAGEMLYIIQTEAEIKEGWIAVHVASNLYTSRD